MKSQENQPTHAIIGIRSEKRKESMQFDKKIGLIRKLLKKKHEAPIIELQIKDYNNSNFYISLLYSRTIDKFKVLYIPLDVVEDNKIEEYCCY